ncbi:MAG: hypothetical protein ACE15F_08620 [bacterium]
MMNDRTLSWPHWTGGFWLLLLPSLLLPVWLVLADFDLVDDSYIPMVYARNLASGHGIVFHPGGERVEGYTSFLWLVFLTLAYGLHIPLTQAAYWTSLAMGMAGIGLAVFLYRQAYHPDTSLAVGSLFWPCMAGLAAVCDVSYAAWSASGMETTAYAFLLLGLAYALIKPWPVWPACLLLLLVSLIRPEGLAFVLMVVAAWYGSGLITRASLWRLALIVALPVSLFLAFRMAYFGYPFPNTFYAKHDFGGMYLLGRGFEYVTYYFRPRPFFLFGLFALLLEERAARKGTGLIAGFALLQIALVTAEGGDHFTLHRFLVPAIPFFSILGIRGFVLCARRLVIGKINPAERSRTRTAWCVLGFGVLLLLPAHAIQLFDFKKDTRCNFAQGAQYHLSVVKWTRSWAKVGLWLQEKYPSGTKIAVINAGAIPYFCELNCIDMLGLNDVTIAHTPARYLNLCHPGHEKSNAEYVLAEKPRFIQLFPLLFFLSQPYPKEKLEEMITYPAQIDLWNQARFHAEYTYKTEETGMGFISYFERGDGDNG